MLPRDRIPWPLPPGYTQVNMCRTKDDDNEVSSSSRLVFTQFIHAQYIIDAHFSFHHSPGPHFIELVINDNLPFNDK